MDTNARGLPHIREAALRATMRNSILPHTALYRYQPAEQSYCYVRHYGTGQATRTQQRHAIREAPRLLSRLHWRPDKLSRKARDITGYD
jgi:hypothetical protein